MPNHKIGSSSAITWYGTKHKLSDIIEQYLPRHTTYVEVFGGSASLLLDKAPSRIEVYNDINQDLVTFFRVLQDEEKFKKLMHKLTYTLYSRQEYEEALATVESEQDEIEKARKIFIITKMAALQRVGGKWGYVVRTAISYPPSNVRKWATSLVHLENLHSRLLPVQIENDTFENIINRYDYKEACFYCDPPFVSKYEWRKRQRIYEEYNSFSEENINILNNQLLNIQGTATITVRPSTEYIPLFKRYKAHLIKSNELDKVPLIIFSEISPHLEKVENITISDFKYLINRFAEKGEKNYSNSEEVPSQ